MCETASGTVMICNKLGLHARPAMMFVQTASGFGCDIGVRRVDQSETVDGKSIMQMMMLAATHGTNVQITATGPGAEEAVQKLIELVNSRFDED